MLQNSIALSEEDVFREFATNYDIGETRVLEVGGRLSPDVIKHYSPKEWWAIDPRNENKYIGEGYYTVKGVSQFIRREDEYFDRVFSCNAFQHIHRLDLALAEMHRVLKPGGVLYANFGPIWSAPDGSHIEGLVCGDRVYNFWNDAFIPDWYHLVYTCKELYDILRTRVQDDLAIALVEYVHMNNWLNRLTYFDFEQLIKKSPFREVLFFGGSKEFGYSREIPEYDHQNYKFVEWLTDNKNNMGKFRLRDLKICLRK